VVNPSPTVIANAVSTDVCFGYDILLTGSGASTYVWDHGVADAVAFVAVTSETYTVIGTDTDGCINTSSIDIVVNIVTPPVVTIVSDRGLLVTLQSDIEENIQWYESGVVMDGETNPTIEVPRSYVLGGKYTVEYTEDNCSVFSDELMVAILDVPDNQNNELTIWPNPATKELNFSLTNAHGLKYSVVSLTGKIIQRGAFELTRDITNPKVDISELTNGIYFLVIHERGIILKFLKAG
jgi:hypothetical protein